MEEKNTYKYHLKLGRRVLFRSITDDLVLREVEHQREFPGTVIKQIGRCTTRAAALKWEREGGKRHYKFHLNGGKDED